MSPGVGGRLLAVEGGWEARRTTGEGRPAAFWSNSRERAVNALYIHTGLRLHPVVLQ